MANSRHGACAIRALAAQAKRRLKDNRYKEESECNLPRGVSPAQKQLYIKLKQLLDSGEEVVNPIQQLADKRLMESLSHEERQRYVFQLAADYVAMKKELDGRLSGGERG